MDNSFLLNFMQVAQEVTHAERSLAVDASFATQDTINIEESLLGSSDFNEMVASTAADALQQGEPVITNNMIQDPDKAPETNVHLSNLRLVVVIPLAGYGAIYLDQSVRQGVFERDTIDKLVGLAGQLINEGQTDLTKDELLRLYKQL